LPWWLDLYYKFATALARVSYQLTQALFTIVNMYIVKTTDVDIPRLGAAI